MQECIRINQAAKWVMCSWGENREDLGSVCGRQLGVPTVYCDQDHCCKYSWPRARVTWDCPSAPGCFLWERLHVEQPARPWCPDLRQMQELKGTSSQGREWPKPTSPRVIHSQASPLGEKNQSSSDFPRRWEELWGWYFRWPWKGLGTGESVSWTLTSCSPKYWSQTCCLHSPCLNFLFCKVGTYLMGCW